MGGPKNCSPNVSALPQLSKPGEFPFSSGIHPRMYMERPWTIRQYAGFGDVFRTNELLKNQLKSGVKGLSIAFDLPTQLGYDPDQDISKYDVGRIGVSVSNLQEMRILLKDIDLKSVSISMTINASAIVLIVMYKIVAEENGFSLRELRGTLQNDILKEFISRGAYTLEISKSLNLFVDTVKYMDRFLPSWNPISISGYHMAEAGANASQEIAFTISNAMEYIKCIEISGLSVETFLRRTSFFFCARTEMLHEIAKFRAARQIWAKKIKNLYPKLSDEILKMRIHAQTAGIELQAQNPEYNAVRVTIQALAAILGGVQSLHTSSVDEALSLPSEDASKLALATQQILAIETDLCKTVDPIGGSFLIQDLVTNIEAEVIKIINEIDLMGGAKAAISNSYQKGLIENLAYEYALDVESGTKKIVGVNTGETFSNYATNFTVPQADQLISRIAKFRNTRDLKPVEQELESLKRHLALRQSVGESVESCLLANASLGEIMTVFRECDYPIIQK